MTHVTHISYKSCKVKYSQHHSLIVSYNPLFFVTLDCFSLWDKRPSCHSASQRHLSALLSVLEVIAAWCPIAGRSPGPWRMAAVGHSAETSPCLTRQEVCGAVFNFGDPCAQGSPKAGLWLVHVPSSKASLNMGRGLTSSPLQKFSTEAFFHL